jgi:hypothetical protein
MLELEGDSMRLLLRTQPTPTTITDPRNDTQHSGELHLEVIYLEPTEVSPGHPSMTVAKVRADAGGGPVVAVPPPNFNGTSAPVPESVLAQLAPTDLIQFRWVFSLPPKR